MKPIIFLSIILLFLSCFINHEEVLAARKKRDIEKDWQAKMNAELIGNASANDARMQPEKYCDSKCIPTIRPPPTFDAKKDAQILSKATGENFDINENAVLNILSKRGMIQRIQINAAYKQMVIENKEVGNMVYHLRGETRGAFRRCVMALLIPLPAFFAQELHSALTGPVIDYHALVEILCTISNYGVQSIAEFYMTLYQRSLWSIVAEKTPGSFKRVLVLLIQGKRNNESEIVDNAKAVADAQALNGSDAKPWKDKRVFDDMLGTCSYTHLRQVFVEYKNISGMEIEDDIKNEFSGSELEGLLSIVTCIKSKVKFLAERLEEVMRSKKEEAFDAPLIRILVSRSEIDLGDINVEYKKIFKKTIHETFKNKIGGFYRRIMTNMVFGNAPPPPTRK